MLNNIHLVQATYRVVRIELPYSVEQLLLNGVEWAEAIVCLYDPLPMKIMKRRDGAGVLVLVI